MTRTNTLVALALTTTGAVLVVDGPPGIVRLAATVGANAHIVILALAGLAFVLNVAPRGTAAGPLTLVAMGAFVFVASRSSWSPQAWELLGGVMILLGGWLAMTTPVGGGSIDPVRGVTAAFFPREMSLKRDDKLPAQLFIRAVGAKVQVDLSDAGPPRQADLQLFVTCVAGRVELTLPKSWPVVAGRVHTTWRIRFHGKLDSQEPSLHPHEEGEPARLRRLAETRRRTLGVSDESVRSVAVVLHVVGAGGAVVLVGR
jgi:hypothetical protein